MFVVQIRENERNRLYPISGVSLHQTWGNPASFIIRHYPRSDTTTVCSILSELRYKKSAAFDSRTQSD